MNLLLEISPKCGQGVENLKKKISDVLYVRSLARQKNYQMIYHLACLQQCHSITWCSILFGNNVTTVSSQKNLRVLSLDLKGRIGLKTHMTRGLPLSTSASRGGVQKSADFADSLTEVRTRGEGVQKSENSVDALYGSPLKLNDTAFPYLSGWSIKAQQGCDGVA